MQAFLSQVACKLNLLEQEYEERPCQTYCCCQFKHQMKFIPCFQMISNLFFCSSWKRFEIPRLRVSLICYGGTSTAGNCANMFFHRQHSSQGSCCIEGCLFAMAGSFIIQEVLLNRSSRTLRIVSIPELCYVSLRSVRVYICMYMTAFQSSNTCRELAQ